MYNISSEFAQGMKQLFQFLSTEHASIICEKEYSVSM